MRQACRLSDISRHHEEWIGEEHEEHDDDDLPCGEVGQFLSDIGLFLSLLTDHIHTYRLLLNLFLLDGLCH